VKYKKRPPFKRSNNHRNNNESFGNGSMNNGSRVTGSLSTVLEKYKNLAKDATSSGDYIGAENYMQHAEHYSRMINERNARNNNYSNVASNGSLAKESEGEKKSSIPEVSEDDIGNEDDKLSEVDVSTPDKSKKIKDVKDKKTLN
jgi:hypothetical protein